MRPRSWFPAPVPLLLLLFVVSLPAVTTRLNASDEIQFFAWLHSWTFDRDAHFANEYQHFYDRGPVHNNGFRDTFLNLVNENGRPPNFTPIGTAVLWLPFFGAGHVLAMLSGAPADGLSQPYISLVTYGSAIYGCAALLLTVAIVRRVAGRGAWAAFVVWVGTPLLFYMYVAPGFAHATSAFAVSLFLWTWLRVRDRWTVGGTALLGLTAALLPMVREQDVFFVAGPALDFARSWLRSLRDPSHAPIGRRHTTHVIAAIAGVAACAAAYTPQLIAYAALNGHPGPTRLVTRKMSWSAPHLAGVLFSPEHGLFFWTPLALLSIAGLVLLASGRVRAAASDARWVGGLALLMFLLQAYVAGSVESWTVAGSFGQRRFVAVTPLLALGLAVLTPATTAARRLFGLLIVLCIWWNLGLMAQFGLHLMDRQRLSPLENARITFVELPRVAPSIAYRYLVDRDSLFGLPRR